ncbi:hypothetical protein SAMD00019534_082370 [Acytostelium subglobosum LB1]|uniref:hypothetical protein n=1 Tax=Acytostelium subglobosum LB1 TaxID=1410327 RepID=UPI000644FF07|nr:hypothetical protein SAMD00019534_082370 [Acytostelium subglobosum LB1]GAM25062.1 hypothetical protein SAMD00019534_082370 [Acytostelium subglobosum LB1]|eukprot:XP_012752151.1 hypothetical protein SAMD00019534_082370 [Acytostelium subglobosum LB1]
MISCAPSSVSQDFINLTISITKEEYMNQFTNPDAVVNIMKFQISDVQQGLTAITVKGWYFDLYSKSLEVKVGAGIATDLTFTATTLIFSINPLMTGNGSFVIRDTTPSSTALYSDNRQWKPFIKFVKPNVSNDPNVQDWMLIGHQLVEGSTSITLSVNGVPVTLTIINANLLNITLMNYVSTVVIKMSSYSNMTPFNYTYPAPYINKVTTNTTITGDAIATITVTGNPLQVLGVWTYSNFRATLPINSRSGQMIVTNGLDGLPSIPIPILLRPKIESISPPPTAGGVMTVTGWYIAPKSFANESVLDITVNGVPCTNPTMLDTSFTPYTITCNSPPGSGGALVVFNSMVAQSLMYQSPSIDTVSSTLKGRSGAVTITGSNFGSKVSVMIGTIPCTLPTVNTECTEITCRFISDADPASQDTFQNAVRRLLSVAESNDTISMPVTVVIDGQSVTKSKFIYSANIEQCASPCQHGKCVLGDCQCDDGFTGKDCSITLDPSLEVDVPQPKENTPSIELGSKARNVEFNISLAGIREINPNAPDNQVIKYVNMTNTIWNWVNYTVSGGNTIHVYNTSLKGVPGFEIIVEMTVFDDNEMYNFEGDHFQAPKNSIKYRVTLSKWPFASMNNYLEVLFQSASGQQVTCGGVVSSSKVTSTTTNTKNSLRLMEIYQGTGMLRAFYSDRLLVDGRLSYSKVSVVDPTDPAMAGLGMDTDNNNVTTLFVVTSLSVPSFNQSAVIDPNFASLLVINKAVTDCGGNSNDRKWFIPVVVVASVIGLALIVVVGVIIARKNRVGLLIARMKLNDWRRKQ